MLHGGLQRREQAWGLVELPVPARGLQLLAERADAAGADIGAAALERVRHGGNGGALPLDDCRVERRQMPRRILEEEGDYLIEKSGVAALLGIG